MAIDLKKGTRIELTKIHGNALKHVCIGINWGQIKKKTLFGLLTSHVDVDLDSSAAMFDANKNLLEAVYYKRLISWDGAVKHSGDDLTGDLNGNDDIDNEVITIDFEQVTKKTHSIVLFLNSYKGQDFATIPYSQIRIYEGAPHQVERMLATFDLSADPKFAGNVSMVMGKFFMQNDEWIFEAIGEPVDAPKISSTIRIIQERFL